MTDRDESNYKKNHFSETEEISLSLFFHLIFRRKWLIISSVALALILAILYNFFSNPVYESYVIVKKDMPVEQGYSREIQEMFSMQTQDQLETEIEILKTRTVLEKVINELKLTLTIEKFVFDDEQVREFNYSFIDYDNYLNLYDSDTYKFPRFIDIKVDPTFAGGYYFIENSGRGTIKLYNVTNDQHIKSFESSSMTEFSIPGLKVLFNWPNSKRGERIYFRIDSMEEIVDNLIKNILVSRIGETNLAKLSVKTGSPISAQRLASTIMEKYREVRLANKRQTINSSFNFVNDQLSDIGKKLETAEKELSQFKSDNQIVTIGQSSKISIDFISNLETEKNKTDLELTEYQNKVVEMEKELKKKGYVDQTFLTPSRGDGRESPFSALLNQLSDLEIQYLTLLQKRKENHPDVIIIKEQIVQIKTKLAEYNQNTLTSYKIMIKSLQKKRSNLNRLIRRYSDKLENMPGHESELIRLTRDKNVYEKMFTLLLDKREEFRLAELSKLQDIIIVETARVPIEPVGPRKVLNIILSIIIGLVLGVSIVIIKDFFNDKLSTLEEIKSRYPFSILTVVPKYDKALEKIVDNSTDLKEKLVVLMKDQPIYRESYRLLGTKMRAKALNAPKALLISSCEENTGKTSIVANLAANLVRGGKKVLVLDCDLRKATISKFLNVSANSPGLINIMTNGTNPFDVIQRIEISSESGKMLNYIHSGGTTDDSSEVLESDNFKHLIKKLSSNYDHILIDTPPITKIVDTLVIGRYVKDLILVLRPNHTFKSSVAIALEELEQSKINVLGCIINALDIKKLPGRYKYGYSYGYYKE